MQAPPFTWAGVRHGFLRAQPLGAGVLIYGLVFGILATEARLSALEAVLMSIFVYSGSAQMAALQVMREGAALLPLLATVLLMNARYLLYGAAMYPWLGGAPPAQSYSSLFFLGDANWALSMAERERGQDDAGFVLGSGLAMFLPWVGGTLAGRLMGGLIPDPASLGMDFMLVAFSAALMMGMWRSRADLWPVLAALAAGLVLVPMLSAGWVIVIAALAAGAAGALMHRP
ncbi:ABC transporter permease [Rhodovarius crocodyli]|uniref:ABC transporter permease n=1 Tax=Rhodovarius crocodyli TaxID=1979269 RepID=A0A437MNV5_9PROT|nr:AzlC family ABC transporter permease [Rhodovarius crocodyli]RVT99331.1 ABC transporter permease [Rhodovarius crocodyli]